MLQYLWNGLFVGSILFLTSLGLSMGWDLLNFPNVAHAALVTFGAYMGYTISEIAGLSIGLACVSSIIVPGFVGISFYLFIFRPLIHREAGIINLIIASLGLTIFFRHTIAQIWGDATQLFDVYFKPFSLGAIRTTAFGILVIVFALGFALFFHILLTRTKLGKAMRATSNDKTLAEASGINTVRIQEIVWFIGSAMAGLGGFFFGYHGSISPVLGWDLVITLFAVVILGGIGSVYGSFAAAYIIGFTESLSVIFLTSFGLSSAYKVVVSFIILIIVLIFKPEGLADVNLSGLIPWRKKDGNR